MGRAQGTPQTVSTVARRRPSRPSPKPGDCRPVLISIQPQWVRLIQTGAKTVELRRQRSGCEPGTPIAIYTSFPVKRIETKAKVKAVHALAPQELWDKVGQESAVSKEEFFAYLGDLETAYGIELEDVTSVDEVSLDRSGPQSWRYLFTDETEGQKVMEACDI